MADAICLGELLIDFVPTETGTDLISAPAFKKAAGGAPGNVAVGLQQLGINTAFIGKVGDDPFGHFLSKTLSDSGIDVSSIRYSAEARTALAFVSLKADGDRDFMFYRHPSADMLLTEDEIDVDAIKGTKLLHFGSISLIGQPSRDASLYAVETARNAGCRISYDPNLRLDLWPGEAAAHEGMLLGLSLANIVKISEDEAEFLSGFSDLDKAVNKLWRDDLQLMVVTRGKNGCSYFTADFRGEVDGFEVDAVDATGAGDGFVAGLIQGILKHPETLNNPEQLSNLCGFANAVGAITTTRRGAIPALPGFEEVEKFLNTNQ